MKNVVLQMELRVNGLLSKKPNKICVMQAIFCYDKIFISFVEPKTLNVKYCFLKACYSTFISNTILCLKNHGDGLLLLKTKVKFSFLFNF
jgi:hypothetical protein